MATITVMLREEHFEDDLAKAMEDFAGQLVAEGESPEAVRGLCGSEAHDAAVLNGLEKQFGINNDNEENV